MAHKEEKERAILLRKKGMSYSQIKAELGTSKSTLSGWLEGMPLSRNQINALRANSEVRIEKYRTTMLKKRNERLAKVFLNVSKDISRLSEREFLVAGYFLYWAEGAKTTPYVITLSNTDPHMIRMYIKWLKVLRVPKEKIVVKLHLYIDMDVDSETAYWAREIDVSKKCFRKPYIKKSRLSDLTYTSRGHGTCNVIVENRDIAERVHQGLRYIRNMF